MKIVCLLTFCLLFSCGEKTAFHPTRLAAGEENARQSDSAHIDSVYYGLRLQAGLPSYTSAREKCRLVRHQLLREWQTANTDSIKQEVLRKAGDTLTTLLYNTLFPYWYGTPWAFEGYTDVPQKGETACGYFVSTTLKHAGFNVNRYKLAQQSPRIEAISIQLSDSVLLLRNISPRQLRTYFLGNKADGLYFTGLSAHVGYLLKKKNELFFIHANYMGSEGVCIEKAEYSAALANSSLYYVAGITHNRDLVYKWISGAPLAVR